MRTSLVAFLAITLAASSLFTACDKSPISPTPREPPTTVVEPRLIVSGNYTLTITAAEECSVGESERRLPEEARIRTYNASVGQKDAELEIRVTGPTSQYGGFYGRIEAESVTFNLAWYDDSGEPEPSIIEGLSASGFLAVRGHASTVGSATRLAGTLRGDLRILAVRDMWRRPSVLCFSENHQFVLSR